MRTCLAFFLAVFLSLNTAYAAVVGVCDTLEHTQQSDTAHFGHHSHEHDDGHDYDHEAAQASVEGVDSGAAASDHHHAHVHPGFSTIASSSVDAIAFAGRSPLVPATLKTFVSAPQIRLDRPPRAALA